jgi:tetratricopeptide (TPR) repeat protein
MRRENLLLLIMLLFTGCGHYFFEPQPVPQKEILTQKTVKKEISKKVRLNTEKKGHQQSKAMVQNADTLFFEGKYDLAYAKYVATLRIDPDNLPATLGLSKCYLKNFKYDRALSTLKTIENSARHTRYAPEYYFLYIQASTSRLYWDNLQLKKIENAYYYALPAYRKQSDLYYFMGLIYKKVKKYNRAKTFFSKVVSIGGPYKENAYEKICKIKEHEQCNTCSYQQKLPLIPQISRADMCYILHHDLNIHELFQKNSNYEFKPQPQIAMDISSHSLKEEIEAVLLINLLGLSLFPKNSFEPEMPITRADFALIIYEIINRINPQAVSSSKSEQYQEGIADVHPSHHFFRAILFCTNQLIMFPLETGEFDPYGPVSGADALMSIRTLKHFFVQPFK